MNGKKPIIGVALSAGALRGLCHLGVLRVLEEEGVPVDYVAGTSIGAFIGALYAKGLDLDMMCEIAKNLHLRHLVDPVFPRKGLLAGKKVMEILDLFLGEATFADLEKPLAVVATDLKEGTEVIIKEGRVVDGVRASIAIPGIFTPVLRGNQVLVDGGLVNRVPVSVARQMGADRVIAVKIGLPVGKKPLKGMADILIQSFDLMQMQVLGCRTQRADIIIEPKVEDFHPGRLDNVASCIQEGVEAARRVLPQIKAFFPSEEGHVKG